jgi:hypothetical protein
VTEILYVSVFDIHVATLQSGGLQLGGLPIQLFLTPHSDAENVNLLLDVVTICECDVVGSLEDAVVGAIEVVVGVVVVAKLFDVTLIQLSDAKAIDWKRVQLEVPYK